LTSDYICMSQGRIIYIDEWADEQKTYKNDYYLSDVCYNLIVGGDMFTFKSLNLHESAFF